MVIMVGYDFVKCVRIRLGEQFSLKLVLNINVLTRELLAIFFKIIMPHKENYKQDTIKLFKLINYKEKMARTRRPKRNKKAYA